jgi:hypothetical protein
VIDVFEGDLIIAPRVRQNAVLGNSAFDEGMECTRSSVQETHPVVDSGGSKASPSWRCCQRAGNSAETRREVFSYPRLLTENGSGCGEMHMARLFWRLPDQVRLQHGLGVSWASRKEPSSPCEAWSIALYPKCLALGVPLEAFIALGTE